MFVGSAEAGAQIGAAAARAIVPSVLELGGKSAKMVFADADLDRALIGAQAAIFGGAGQSCVAGSRLFVHRSIHAAFVERLSRAAARIPVGAPTDPATQIGPINNRRQWDKIADMVEAAAGAGATIAAGGACPAALRDTGGFYYGPTIVDGVAPDAAIAREEVFGPVLPVQPFDGEDEAVALANGTPYGLAGAVWTGDGGRGHRVAAALRAGTVWVNGYSLTFRADVALDPEVLQAPISDSYGEFMHGAYRRVSKPFQRIIGEPPRPSTGGHDVIVNETIDASVFERWRANAGYRPQNLQDWARRYSVDLNALTEPLFVHDPHTVVPETLRPDADAPPA